MRTRALVLVAAVGCAVLPASPATAATFGMPVVVTGLNLSEPGIDIDGISGAVYLTAVPGLGTPSHVFRSTTGGTTWFPTPAGARAALPGGAAADLTVSPVTGALAITDLWGASSTVGRSNDGGASWTAQPVQGELVQDRPWVAAAAGNVVYHATAQAAAGIVVARSADGGYTYGTRTLAVPAATTGCFCPSGNLVAETADRIGFAYATSTGGVRFARSVDGAMTFTSAVVRHPSPYDTLAGFPVVASGGNGVLAATWTEVGSATTRIGFSRSADFGASWSVPAYVVTTGTSLHPWVDVHGSRVGISLYRTSAAGTPGTVPANALWYESYVESFDNGASWSTPTVADPMPVKSGPICTDGGACGSDAELGDFQSMAFDVSGTPVLAYVRSLDGAFDVEVRVTRGT